MIADDGRRYLLALARAALEAEVRGSEPAEVPSNAIGEVSAGAFVSVMRGKELRACLGEVRSGHPLAQTVGRLGRQVAAGDPRFADIRVDELHDTRIEISILSPPRRVKATDVQVGRHGVIVRRAGRSALLLPKVATENRWDVSQLLAACAEKAGMPPGAWRDPDVEILVFEAEEFGE